MDDSLLTKCPHCKTLFRIQHEHLAIANGEVRCGVCFKVFNAKTEGLSYSEEPSVKTPQPHTSREQATELLENLELPHTADNVQTDSTVTPNQADINQLHIDDEPIEQFFFRNRTKAF